jgi:4-carboxymuconolactone decarboxylase
MTKLFAAIGIAALIATMQPGRAEDITRFAPLKADELSPAQKAWADAIAVPPRNAKFGAAPYRAYIRNPELAPKLSALSDYLRWNTTLPPRLSEFAIVITARNWTAQYEWAAHYPLALKAGLDVKILGDLSAGRRRTTCARMKPRCMISPTRSIATRRSAMPFTRPRWRNSASAA